MINKPLPKDWKDTFRENIQGLTVKGREAMGICPFHDDTLPSFSVNIETSQWICFAGCGDGNYYDFKRMILNPPPRLERKTRAPHSSQPPEKGKIVAEYIYKDAEGKNAYFVTRYEPKSFRQNKVGGYGMEGVERLPYNLDEIWKRKDEVLFWVEGEKDADNLRKLGLLASTSSGGANGWDESIARKIPNEFISVIPDQDMPGQAYASEVIRTLNKLNKNVLQWDTDTKDISDYLNKNPSVGKEELKNIIWRDGRMFFSKEKPMEYLTRNGISIEGWERMGNNKTSFLTKQLKKIYGNLEELIDPHHGTIVDLINEQARITRDSTEYEKFCSHLASLVVVKDFYKAFSC